ncbi:MAG: hypothetical protein FWG98_13350 [Candidatus Cloacimonetes bacterium]|nr:hypothetical protein [Candidatus Cloacimonadota bacterium]
MARIKVTKYARENPNWNECGNKPTERCCTELEIAIPVPDPDGYELSCNRYAVRISPTKVHTCLNGSACTYLRLKDLYDKYPMPRKF